ncbi:MAG: flagellar biosynthetic protein FliR [Rhodospirillales bacterium]
MLESFVALNIWKFLLVFARVGSAFGVLPGFSAPYVSVRTRLTMGLLLAFALYPAVEPLMPGRPATVGLMILLILSEMIIGFFLGLVPRFLVAAVQVAGTVIAFVSSLANSFVQDPLAEQQSSIVAGFMSTVVLVLIFVSDSHHLMLRALADSYSLFEPGKPPIIGDFPELMAHRVAEIFRLGVQLASPLIIVGLTYYISLGILGRLMPALPVFFVGLPIQLGTQSVVFMLTLSGMMLVFMRYFQDSMYQFIAP